MKEQNITIPIDEYRKLKAMESYVSGFFDDLETQNIDLINNAFEISLESFMDAKDDLDTLGKLSLFCETMIDNYI